MTHQIAYTPKQFLESKVTSCRAVVEAVDRAQWTVTWGAIWVFVVWVGDYDVTSCEVCFLERGMWNIDEHQQMMVGIHDNMTLLVVLVVPKLFEPWTHFYWRQIFCSFIIEPSGIHGHVGCKVVKKDIKKAGTSTSQPRAQRKPWLKMLPCKVKSILLMFYFLLIGTIGIKLLITWQEGWHRTSFWDVIKSYFWQLDWISLQDVKRM